MGDYPDDGAEVRQPFRPRARVLQLVGDELIGSPRLAVFELVKNAYGADARNDGPPHLLSVGSKQLPAVGPQPT